ncbi:uncharacterized protein MELLADRAFT_63655 [Melampsora larici-populina 98AG31]|uniref:Uncharacterized protein n=1 Tax=Melampsora larici-populina (strain 98AG31 / pathotype 3-4-7) TaxID=747676 RepID=F4RNH1_MELLP|nr:uncharacterized protein MELLADRAFT_63655 [Melampsora larici-populina 98AG31]EGG06098.1 hypothetical protein MELLADRAFT_63655 [Melampsora larici-populina 98AG31]
MELPEKSFLNALRMLPPPPKSISGRPILCSDDDEIYSSAPMIALAADLTEAFHKLFHNYYPDGSDFDPIQLFNYEELWIVVKNYETVLLGQHLRGILGSEPLPGTFELIIQTIELWKTSESYRAHIEKKERDEAKDLAAREGGTRIWHEYKEKMKIKEALAEEKKKKAALRIQKCLENEARRQQEEEEKRNKLRLKLQGEDSL